MKLGKSVDGYDKNNLIHSFIEKTSNDIEPKLVISAKHLPKLRNSIQKTSKQSKQYVAV
jgi:hypothetical protein